MDRDHERRHRPRGNGERGGRGGHGGRDGEERRRKKKKKKKPPLLQAEYGSGTPVMPPRKQNNAAPLSKQARDYDDKQRMPPRNNQHRPRDRDHNPRQEEPRRNHDRDRERPRLDPYDYDDDYYSQEDNPRFTPQYDVTPRAVPQFNNGRDDRELYDESMNRYERDNDGFIPGPSSLDQKRRRFPKIPRPGLPKFTIPKPKLGIPKMNLLRRKPKEPLNTYGYTGGAGEGDNGYNDSYGVNSGYDRQRGGYDDKYGGYDDYQEQSALLEPQYDDRQGVHQLNAGGTTMVNRKFGCSIPCYVYLPTRIARRLRRR